MIPDPTDPRWKDLVEHPERYNFDFLALKILMQRVARMPNTQRASAIGEIHALFRKHERLMGKDASAVFG
jgi:hypothetical protein